MSSAITGPIAPYSNVPINAQYYKPHKFFIEDIQRSSQAVVTTSTDNDFVLGQEVRFVIPEDGGMRELNGVSGYIVEIISTDQFVVDVDTSKMTEFNTLSTSQILPIGDINSGQTNTNGRASTKSFIPGSFINISPV